MDIAGLFDYVAAEFKKEKINFLLVGGFAVNFHKVSRSTDDIDLLITTSDYQKAADILKRYGYDQPDLHDNFARLRSSKPGHMIVDFLFVDSDTIKTMLSESQPAKISQNELRIPSLKHLLALKLHAIRNNMQYRLLRDLPDICNLMKANKLSPEDEEIKSLFKKYGNEEIYKTMVYFMTEKG